MIRGVQPTLDIVALDERNRALRLLRQFGWNWTSFQILQPQFKFWFLGNRACVAYVDTGRAWIVAGAPVAAADSVSTVARAFVDDARQQHRRVVFFGSEGRLAAQSGFKSILIGRQPVFDATQWLSIVQRRARLREQLNRARAKGLRIESVSPSRVADSKMAMRLELESLIARWLSKKAMPKMGFLSEIQPFAFAHERRYFIAHRGDQCVGFAAMAPVYQRQGWYLENLVRAPDAPNGTAESLIDVAARDAAESGSGYFTFGLTPLAGNIGFWLAVAKRVGSPLYGFAGIERFREKFRPTADLPIYIAYPSEQTAISAVYHSLVAFAQGGLVRFGGLTLLHNAHTLLGTIGRSLRGPGSDTQLSHSHILGNES